MSNAKQKLGRPRKRVAEKKSKTIFFRVTVDEARRIRAAGAGKFARRVTLAALPA